MAKKKKNNILGMIPNLISIACSVVVFISLLFSFYGVKVYVSLANSTTKTEHGLSDFFKYLTEDVGDSAMGYRVACVFLIIALVFAGLCLVCSLLNMFIKNKTLKLISIIVGGLTIIVCLVFMILMIVGSSNLGSEFLGTKTTYYPHLAAYLITGCGIGSGVFTALALKK